MMCFVQAMQSFTTLSAIAAPLPEMNIDTDMIIPKQFLRTIERKGLAKGLFYERRFNADGTEKSDFILNQAPYRDAHILITGENFGCGSSREHAPWALLDFGIRCIIAPSFADIFYNNCFKNGILPITLPQEQIDDLLKDLSRRNDPSLTIDLANQTVSSPGATPLKFEIEPFRKHCLLNGLDDIGLTLAHVDAIDDFEARQKTERPWLWSQS